LIREAKWKYQALEDGKIEKYINYVVVEKLENSKKNVEKKLTL